jgi:hypothetical protein
MKQTLEGAMKQCETKWDHDIYNGSSNKSDEYSDPEQSSWSCWGNEIVLVEFYIELNTELSWLKDLRTLMNEIVDLENEAINIVDEFIDISYRGIRKFEAAKYLTSILYRINKSEEHDVGWCKDSKKLRKTKYF